MILVNHRKVKFVRWGALTSTSTLGHSARASNGNEEFCLFVCLFVCFVLRHINLISHLMPNQVKENKSEKKFKGEINNKLFQPIGLNGGACGVMVIVVGIGHDDTSSNPGRDDCISHSTWERYESNYSPSI